jgi:hypothetical protein
MIELACLNGYRARSMVTALGQGIKQNGITSVDAEDQVTK